MIPRSDGISMPERRRLAALIRGGATWEQAVAAVCAGVSAAVLAAWRPIVEKDAAEPGPVAKLRTPPSPEEECRRLDAWVESQEEQPVVVRRSIGGDRPARDPRAAREAISK